MENEPRIESGEPEKKDEIFDLVIKLPEDQEKREKLTKALQEKFKEYEDRRAKTEKKGEEESTHAMYKRVILGQLLEKGELKMGDLLEDLSKTHGGVDREKFDDAAVVILNYTVGGSIVRGGTGLK